MMRIISIVSMGLILVSLTGCFSRARPNDPRYAPVALEQMTPPANLSGSIYQSGYEITLFEDMKARRVGDIITVVLVENTEATKQANTKTSKKVTADVTNPTLLGSTPQFSVPFIPLAANKKNNLGVDVDADRTFEGKGDSTQNNRLSGTITVTVSQVLPNGYLRVRGEKWITLNHGDEFIRLEGIVRPQDVTPENTINSNLIADARITYSGRGFMADNNAAGWLARFLSTVLWPI